MKTEQKLKKKLFHAVGEAIADYGMIKDGDRIMVCLSGGKDSYTLLTLLLDLKRRAPVHFDLLAVSLDQGQPGFRKDVITQYLAALEVPFRVIERDTFSIVNRMIDATDARCSLCARLRRGILYKTAVNEGCSKIALGHHADDILQTFLLNLFFSGSLKTMPPLLISEDGRNKVIRPLAYCWERDIEAFARLQEYPIIGGSFCGPQERLQRKRMHRLIGQLEAEIPNLRNSMLSALGRVRPSHLLDRKLISRLSQQPSSADVSRLRDNNGQG